MPKGTGPRKAGEPFKLGAALAERASGEVDARKVVRVELVINPPVGLKQMLREPMEFKEHLRVTLDDGSIRDVCPKELPRLAARFFARLLGSQDAFRTVTGGRRP